LLVDDQPHVEPATETIPVLVVGGIEDLLEPV
jgi:hypothetical protein